MEFEYRNSKVITEQTKIRDYLFNFYACLIKSVFMYAPKNQLHVTKKVLS